MLSWAKTLGLALLALFAPIKAIMITAGILIGLDLVLGVLAARKRGEAISSAALRRTVSKMMIYQVAIISGFLCETYLLGNLIPVSKLVAAAIGMTEMKSCLENLDELNGSSIFRALVTKLGSSNDSSGDEPPKAS